MSDLDTLNPGREITVGGETFAIKPLRFGQLPEVTKRAAPITKAIKASIGDGGINTVLDWVDLLAAGGEDLLVLLAYMVGKPRAWLDTLETDEGVGLLQAVYEVNVDFFNRRVLPLIVQAPADALQIGATSSPTSSPEATAEPTSTATP